MYRKPPGLSPNSADREASDHTRSLARTRHITTTSGFRFSVQTAIPSDTAQQGIEQVFHILNNFDIPVGVAREESDGVIPATTRCSPPASGWIDESAAITGKGPSARHEIFYLGESTVGAVRIDDYKFRFIDQPAGWLGEKTHSDVPYITNLRLDPFERTGWPNNGTKDGAQQYFDWFKYQFWRFVFVQQLMGKEIQTFLDYPPMQRGASFNLDAIKAEMQKKMDQAEAATKGPSK